MDEDLQKMIAGVADRLISIALDLNASKEDFMKVKESIKAMSNEEAILELALQTQRNRTF